MPKPSFLQCLAAGLTIAFAGCDTNPQDATNPTLLLAVSPLGGATDVAVTADLTATFSHRMMPGMEGYVALHMGSISDPTVPLSCGWSRDETTLTCHPASPLAAEATYTFHLGGGMMDADGREVDLDRDGMGMGGQRATGDMMGSQSGMMGDGWTHHDGSYGMTFEFTTR